MIQRKRGRRGAVMVEFAIVSVLLFTLVFGIIEFGLLITDSLAIHQVAFEGARTAAIGATTSVITDRVIASSSMASLTSSNVTLEKRTSSSGGWSTLGNASDGTGNNASHGDYIRVTVSMNHQWVTGLFSSSSTPVRAAVTTRRE